MVHIPKSAVLSVRACAFADVLANRCAPYGQGAQLGLALAVYLEMLRGPQSKWAGYLRSLPSRPPALAVFWGEEAALFSVPTARTAGAASDLYRESAKDAHGAAGIPTVANREDAHCIQGSEAATQAALEDGREARRWARGTQLEPALHGDAQGPPLLVRAPRTLAAFARADERLPRARWVRKPRASSSTRPRRRCWPSPPCARA